MTDSPVPAAAAVELHAGALRLALRPDLGGSIAGLWHDGLAVLRSTEPAALTASRPSGCYPLVPYSNRLGFRRFRWHGKDHTTEPNFDAGNPHSVHGVAWLRPWQLVGHDDTAAELRYVHAADAHWPFDFEVTQRFSLEPDALTVSLAFINTATESQPVGLGWHPYFPKRSHSRLHIECSQRWESDPGTQLPLKRSAQAGIDAEVRHLEFDHCFEGFSGAARLRDEKLSLKLSSSLTYLVVFTPQSRDYFCVEPVSHVSDAIHLADPLAHGLLSLEPGKSAQAWMKLDVARA